MSNDIGPMPDRRTLDLAYDRVRAHAHRTPVLRSTFFDERLGAQVFFKCENFQKVGAFKFRGAINAIFSLDEDRLKRGVVAHSSGNHAQAVALAAHMRGARATIIMPENAPKVKIAAVRGYGAQVVLCEPTQAARHDGVDRVIREEGAMPIHPYNDWAIIAGQATAARELLEEVPDLDIVLGPIGGGGLLSGTALTCHHLSPTTRVIGAEPRAADDAKRSLELGEIQPSNDPESVADGLLSSLGPRTFQVLSRHVERVLTVEDDVIIATMRKVWERMKIIIEPSCAVPLAALLDHAMDVHDRRVGIILTGGNVDLDRLPWSNR